MNIFFYCPWHNKNEWLNEIKKKFKSENILTFQDKPQFTKIEFAIIWNL